MGAGIAATEAKVVHQRPAVMQDLSWRPSRWGSGSSQSSHDPVEQIVFSFYNDQLFRIVVEYGRQSTEGMTSSDLVDAISVVYGTPMSRTAPSQDHAPSQVEAESGSRIARWGDTATHSVVLYQTASYNGSYRVILTDGPRAALAAKADTEARRLDAREAPQRELDRQDKARTDEREAAAKARQANTQGFQP
jgi:hypothetical protein